jgi:hypothetical protein
MDAIKHSLARSAYRRNASIGLKMETTFTVFVTRPRWVLFDYAIRIANCSSLWSFADIYKEITKFKISRVGFAPL